MAPEKKSSGAKKLVVTIATSKQDTLDPVAFKGIKEICRRDESAIGQVFHVVQTQMSKPNAAIRLNCWRLLEQLFNRSHVFRLHVIESLEEVVHLAAGTDPSRPLPPPREVAARLRTEALEAVRGWVERYSSGYPQLRVSYAVLQRSIDFRSLSLGKDCYTPKCVFYFKLGRKKNGQW
jgi:hypothetical protein